MARAKVVHSQDAVAVIFKGDKRHPEPSEGRILFPGGHISVTRTRDGNYWAHFGIETGRHLSQDIPGQDYLGKIIGARIDRDNKHASADSGDVLVDGHIEHIALLVQRGDSA